ncbi:ABC transporter ATP-binding protein [Vibrio salilacus]|uniref:ABC transporter ATP-binding protein n=1 Tax=Vibrio salilacus TaxID=1323749 RepID=UPI0012FDCC42|nr:ABC transporter ATP-binding protein [Vibrio salilacus]
MFIHAMLRTLMASTLILISLPSWKVHSFEIAVGEIYTNRFAIGEQQDVYVPEALTKIYAKLGKEVQLVFLPDERAVKMANMGIYNALDLRTAPLETGSNLLRVEPELYTVDVVAVSLNDYRIENIDQLSDLKVVAQLGMQYTKNLSFKNEIFYVSTPAEAAEFISKNRADVWITTFPIVALAMPHYPNIKVISGSLLEEKLYHYIHKSQEPILAQLSLSIMEFKSQSH